MIEEKLEKIGIITLILILSVGILVFSGIRTVKSGEVGIKVRFGKVIDTNLKEGINFKVPIIEKIVRMNIKVQKAEVDMSSASKDLQDVHMKIAVNYRVDGKKAPNLYKNVGTKYEEVVLNPAIQESVKAVTSKYTAEELITKRNEVSDNCEKELNEKISMYGLMVDSLNITDFDFSDEFNKAIEEKQVAEQKVLTAKQELEKEKIEAEKKLVKARAEKEANELKQKSLTDNIIKEKMIEKWNGELPKVSSGSNLFNVESFLK